MTADRLPRNLRRRAATERIVGWSWPPAPVLDQLRCHCGRPVPASSACGDCCAEHDHPPKAASRLPEHLRTDDINDYLRQKGEIE